MKYQETFKWRGGRDEVNVGDWGDNSPRFASCKIPTTFL